jgi:uncharacterized protein DUF6282
MFAMSPDWLADAIDLHVHAAPSLFPRWGDGLDVVRASAAAGMAGVLLKAHEGSTVHEAAILNHLGHGIRVHGGVVLNRYVGGLNPAAVHSALRLGGRCVWLPTIDAAGHAHTFGSTGVFPTQHGAIQSPHGIGILNTDGTCRESVLEILDLVAKHDALLATGHITASEVPLLIRAARAAGCRRLLIQHATFPVPNLTPPVMTELAAAGSVIELTYLSISPMWRTTTVAHAAELLTHLGGDNVVLTSDAGQSHNPSPPEALRSFAQSLYESGAPIADIKTALTTTPRRLIEP